ncbi:tetratricopeptide repeat protein [Streptomyces hydrogenans]|uniref:tetratricopeptide repeat protein n=1 Tax=Streptomyces hydrogenans TaxID=1873719 RepID=UPI0036B209EC
MPDVALLLLDQEADEGHTTAVRWGRPQGIPPLHYSGIGIPAFSTLSGGGVQYENLRGELAHLTTAGRRWVLDCRVWPAATQQKERPWAGASGTAIFTSGHLVGVAVEYGTGMGERRLTAEPVHLLLTDPGFTTLLTEYGFPGTRNSPEDVTAPAGPASGVVWPQQFGTVPELATAYQHRDAVDQLTAALAAGDTTIQAEATSTGNVSGEAAAVVTGLGGVGKTQLAAHHIQQVRHASGLPVPAGSVLPSATDAVGAVDLLLWITASDTATITATYAQAGQELSKAGVPVATGGNAEQAAQGFLTWLQTTSQRWLVVLDDVPAAGVLRKLSPPATPTGRTLITTRNRDTALTEGRRQISVGLFSPDEAVHYLCQRLAGSGVDLDDTELRQLADDFGYLPLALAQAASYIRENALTLEEYRAELHEVPLDEALPGIDGLPDRQAHTVTAAWTLSIHYANALAPAGLARPLLHVLALLDPNNTPDGITAATALQQHLQQTRDIGTQSPGRSVSERDVKRALRVLHRLHLTDITTDHTLRTHQLLQRTLRETLAPGEIDRLGTVTADALLETWPEQEVGSGHYRAATASLATHTVLRDLDDGGLHAVLFHAGATLGEAGQAAAARDHYQHLHTTAHRLLGADHPDTLATRHNIARWRGEAGDPLGAARATTELLADQVRVLGPDHPDTLSARHDIANWLGEGGDPASATAAYAEVLDDCLRVLGPDHPQTLGARHNLADWRGEAGDPSGAADAYSELLDDCLRTLGPDHPQTLGARGNLARWRGAAGDSAQAVHAYDQLLTDHLRVLGPDHPQTLTTRHNLAAWRGQAGDAIGAADAFAKLLTDHLRVLGPDHPRTLTTRHNLARWRGEGEDPDGAVDAYNELLTDHLRVLGPDHPQTLTTRHNLAAWRGRADDPCGAANAYAELLTDCLRVLGPDHPQTLTTRGNLAHWRGKAGNPTAAADAFAELLTEYLRVLGPDHSQTLTTRGNLADWRGIAGDPAGASDTYAELLTDHLRIHGPDHPHTLAIRGNLLLWRTVVGDLVGAPGAYAELLTDHLRIHGPDHPHTLAIRYQWADYVGRGGDPASAVNVLRELAEDEARVYGSRDHTEVQGTLAELERWQAILDDEASTRGDQRQHRQ